MKPAWPAYRRQGRGQVWALGLWEGTRPNDQTPPFPPTPFVRRARRLVTYSLLLLFPLVFLLRSCHQKGVIITTKHQVFPLVGFVFIIKPIRFCLCQVPKPLIIIIPRGQSVWGHLRWASDTSPKWISPRGTGKTVYINTTHILWGNKK